MIIKTKDDVVGTKGDAHGDKWHSLRLLHKEDGMGVTLTDSILEPGFQMDLWQKNHFEACYCLEGEGTIEGHCHVNSVRSEECRRFNIYAATILHHSA